ncbi:CYTH domain-containing protein [Streptomyces sp. TLI_171]|uniref:CYTH domain-containing protein n=1 Tax=Streptomyces sp. TLI_171 TaxID=1938859 RepID=UPI000C1924CD|nr:CYTH domain-containing protein [Streptomyces sp. TLI_171]RKE19907.1 CYTH domain-containing protein [Streptomyces sp. TLI_171]
MGVEIERKFLVAADGQVPDGPEADLLQGYLAVGADGAEARLRRRGEDCSLTVKRGTGLVRQEWEVPLEPAQFAGLWPATEPARLEKTRREVDLGGHTAVVDTYAGRLAGLRTVEVEFADEGAAAAFVPPDWFGAEVTDRAEYKNQRLAAAAAPPD